MADKKGVGLLIGIGGPPKLKGRGSEDGGMEDVGAGKDDGMMRSAMSDFIEAVHAKDVDGAMAAMQDYQALCDHDDGEEGADEGGGKY